MFSRNFMKVFPIRKYANITAKGNPIFTKPAAFPPICGWSTRMKLDSQDHLHI